MTTDRLFIDIHVLQDLPPSNLNRDENGSPKRATYGGVDRLRVSSQAWKRAARRHFEEGMGKESLGVRTRRLNALFTQALAAQGCDEEKAASLAAEALTQLGIKAGKKADETSYLLFAGRPQIRAIASALAAGEEVDVKAQLGSMHTLDVALFGRMVADLTQLNVDAAAQVAHAISTHAAPQQFDYFTAVDDEQGRDETGAGMIGTIEFGSATMYRYATVAFSQLVDNLGDRAAAITGVGEFVRSFVLSMPTGHQNSFAAHTRPALVAVVVRSDQPVSLVSAFEQPILSREGMLEKSQRALAKQVTTEGERWGDAPVATFATYTYNAPEMTAAFGPSTSFEAVLDGLRASLDG